jgi:hypothetical protein
VVLLIADAVICGMAILDEIEIYWYLVWQLLDGWPWLHRQRPWLRGSAPRDDAPKDHT